MFSHARLLSSVLINQVSTKGICVSSIRLHLAFKPASLRLSPFFIFSFVYSGGTFLLPSPGWRNQSEHGVRLSMIER
jgi:hypothetical protein